MIRPLISRPLLLLRTSLLSNRYFFNFSSGNQEESSSQAEGQELDRAQNFYRNSIRRININDKGKGKFTEHHLIRLTKLTQKASQLPLLFEGYYNYLGHFTVISSKTVDKMLEKVLHFEEVPLNSTLEIFQNHNYLGYFPAYKITLKFLSEAERDGEILKKFISVLHDSPLIKFDRAIVEKLVEYLNSQSLDQGTFSSIVKLLIQRSSLQIINEEISPAELFTVLAKSLEARLTESQWRTLSSNKQVFEFVNSIKEQQASSDDLHCRLAIVGLSFGARVLFYQNVCLIKDQKRVEAILNCLRNGSESYRASVVGYLEEQQLSKDIKNLVEGLKNGKEDVAQRG